MNILKSGLLTSIFLLGVNSQAHEIINFEKGANKEKQYKNQIFELVKAKSQSSEKDLAPQNMGLIKEFIDQQLPILDANKITENRTLQIEDANKLFLKYL